MKNETPESVGEMNSPISEEDSEIEDVRLFQSYIDAKPEIDTYHEPLFFNDEDVEQTSAVGKSQVIPDNEADFGLQENIKTEKEDKEISLNSELRGYEEEESPSCEEMVRIIKSENPEIISKSRAQRDYRIFPDVDSSFENGNNIEAIDFFLKEKSMFKKPRTIVQECEKNLTISEEGNTQHKNIFPDKEANFILGIDITNEVLNENVSLNSESRELKVEESILDNELVNDVINSDNPTTPANVSIGQRPEEITERDAESNFELDQNEIIAKVSTSNFPLVSLKKLSRKKLEIISDNDTGLPLPERMEDEELHEKVSLNSEGGGIEKESLLDNEMVNHSIESQNSKVIPKKSVAEHEKNLVSGVDKGGKGSKEKRTLRSKPVRSGAYQQRIRKTVGKNIFCRLCKLSFNSNVEKKSHMNLHKRKFQCGQCSYECSLKSILKRHEKIHNNVISKPSELFFECNQKRDLKSQALKPRIVKFKCSQCRYETKFKGHMKRHMQRHRLLQCCECSYKCYNKTNFRKHMLKHWNIKSFKCNDGRNVKRKLKKDMVGQGNRKSFKCSKCAYKTYVKANLNRHELTHTNTKLFNCSECSYRCNDKRGLILHELKHKNGECSKSSYGCSDKKLNNRKTKFKCSECDFDCSYKATLKSHMLKHRNMRVFKCCKCHYVSNLKANLKRHELTHTNRKIFKCSECNYRTNVKGNLLRHMLTHTNRKLFKSSDCSYGCNDRRSLIAHKRKHENGECSESKRLKHHKKFKCSKCNFECTYEATLNSHMLRHINIKLFKCSKCDYVSKLKGSLKRHELTHTNRKLFNCSDCSYGCNDKRQLKSHKLKHENGKCSKSSYGFNDKKLNNRNTKFKCSDCDFNCSYKATLKSHMLKHENMRIFKCSKCDYVSNLKANLKRHELTHTNRKLFNCSDCSYGCNDKRSLIEHKLKYENGECSKSSYRCSDKRLNHQNLKFKSSECDYKTNLKGNLKRHELTHSDEKLCSKRSYGCNDKRQLKSHKLKHEKKRLNIETKK